MSQENARTAVQIIALLMGGGWSIYLYIFLKQRKKAIADLRQTDLNIRNLELQLRQTDLNIRNLELQLRRTVFVRVDISATSFRRPDGPGYCILADVSLTNTGNLVTRIEWDKGQPAFFFRRASFQPDRTPSFTEEKIEMNPRLAFDPNHEVVSHVIRPGATEHLAFAAQVEHPGTYLLSFRVPLNPSPEERAFSEAAGAKLPTAWTAHHYIMVSEEPSNETTTSRAA
jgi:hypothetical protein